MIQAIIWLVRKSTELVRPETFRFLLKQTTPGYHRIGKDSGMLQTGSAGLGGQLSVRAYAPKQGRDMYSPYIV